MSQEPETETRRIALKILIVEDNPESARIIGKLLELHTRPAHVEIRMCSRLDDALKITAEFKADVTLLDLILEDEKDWRKNAEAIRLIHKPVIVMTGLDDPDGEIELFCRMCGAKEVFQKGVVEKFAETLVSTVIGAHLRNRASQVSDALKLRNEQR